MHQRFITVDTARKLRHDVRRREDERRRRAAAFLETRQPSVSLLPMDANAKAAAAALVAHDW